VKVACLGEAARPVISATWDVNCILRGPATPMCARLPGSAHVRRHRAAGVCDQSKQDPIPTRVRQCRRFRTCPKRPTLSHRSSQGQHPRRSNHRSNQRSGHVGLLRAPDLPAGMSSQRRADPRATNPGSAHAEGDGRLSTDGIAPGIRAILLRLPLFNRFPDAKIETFPFPGNPSYNRPAFLSRF
jgi:hypothetical protein